MAPEETQPSNLPEKLAKFIWKSTHVAMERKTGSRRVGTTPLSPLSAKP